MSPEIRFYVTVIGTTGTGKSSTISACTGHQVESSSQSESVTRHCQIFSDQSEGRNPVNQDSDQSEDIIIIIVINQSEISIDQSEDISEVNDQSDNSISIEHSRNRSDQSEGIIDVIDQSEISIDQ